MKKAARLIFLAVGSLLLTACEVPDSLEDFLNWREKFFLHLDPSKIDALLGPIVGILVALATLITLWQIISNLKNAMSPWESKFLTGLSLLLAIGLISLYIPISTMIGEKVLPAELTIDKVFAALHWELSANLGNIVTAGWGITVTLLIPLISAFWQIVMFAIAFIAITISIAGSSIKGIIFAGAEILGWAFFLGVYNTIVTLIGDYYPTWDFGPIEVFVNVFYIGAVFLMMLACYIGVPWLAASLVPSSLREQPEKQKEEQEGKEQRKIDWDTILAFPIPESEDEQEGQTPEEAGSNQKRTSKPQDIETEDNENIIPEPDASEPRKSDQQEEDMLPSQEKAVVPEEGSEQKEEELPHQLSNKTSESFSEKTDEFPEGEIADTDYIEQNQIPDNSEENTEPTKINKFDKGDDRSESEYSQDTTLPVPEKNDGDSDENLLPQMDSEPEQAEAGEEHLIPDSKDKVAGASEETLTMEEKLEDEIKEEAPSLKPSNDDEDLLPINT